MFYIFLFSDFGRSKIKNLLLLFIIALRMISSMQSEKNLYKYTHIYTYKNIYEKKKTKGESKTNYN